MFDSVGHNTDPNQARRSLTATGGVVALAAAFVLATVLSQREVVPPPPEPVEDMVLLFDVPNEPDAEWTLPPPPDPQPRDEEPLPDTGRFDTAIPGMDPDERVRDTGAGEDDTGEVAGEGTGVVEPDTERPAPEPVVPNPVPTQPVPQPGTNVDTEPVYDIAVRNRLRGQYPPAARRRNMGDVTCRMHAWIDRDGEARKVIPVDCPPLFRTYARVTLMEARWETFDAPDVTAANWRKTEIDVPFRQ